MELEAGFFGFVEHAAVSARACVLRTRIPGETRWILLAAGGVGVLAHEAKKAHFTGQLPPGHPRNAAASLRIEGGTVTRIGKRSILIIKGDVRVLVVLRGTNIALLDDGAPHDDEVSIENATSAGDAIAVAIVASAANIFRDDLVSALKKAAARVSRRLAAIDQDLEAMSKAETMLADAQWLVPEAQRAKRGSRELSATDWSADPPRTITIMLDPARTAKEQVDAMFKRARRLKAGRAFAEPRRAQAEAARIALRDLAARAREATQLADLEEIAQTAKKLAPKDFSLAAAPTSKKKTEEPRETGYRTYVASGGAKIFVGRAAKENDHLTFKVARPHDVWLHTKGRRGAHVVVPRERGQDLPADLLVDAAHLAAHFSESRDEGVVDVEYTHRKFLKKPKGGAPGLVIVEREKVIAVRIEKTRLAALLGENA